MTELFQEHTLSALQTLLQQARKIAVLGHTHPDGDALGSTTGLALYLQRQGKDVTCLYPDTPPEHLDFIRHPSVPYFCHDTAPSAAQECIREAELIFLVDANAFSRTDALGPFAQEARVPKVLLDHHLNPDNGSFDLVFSTPEISSASEVVYWLLKALSQEDLPVEIGNVLMAGMTTDTNNFANSVFPSTFRMASELIAAGVDRDALLQKIYNSYRENRVRLLGYMQYRELHILPEGAAYMVMTQDILHRFDVREGESEGLVNMPLAIGPVRMSILLKEEDHHFRVSIRSKKGTSAQNCAQQYFHGGGHENAAGGKLFIGEDISRPEEAPAYLERVLKAFLA